MNRKKATEKQNRIQRTGQLCDSILEQNIYDKLIKVFPDLCYNIKVDERYPYFVDFYIPSKDLFIEINGHPSHGKLPISEHLECDLRITGQWKDTYARRDPEKLRIAQKNNLNYIRIYPSATLSQNYNINKEQDKQIINLILD